MVNFANPRSVNVTLRGKEEKTRWAALAPLDPMPSRYPETHLITDMGIQASWEGLTEAAHLTSLFAHRCASYKALTLEFLSTLQVNYVNKILVSINFRLENVEHTLTLAEFNTIFQLLDEDEEGIIDEPQDYNRNEFWGRITLEEASSSQGPTYLPSRAKINSLRNPVLKYMAKALVCLPFAHKELGSMSSDILFILWGMLAHRRINTGYYMIKHLERHSKKKSGKLCCGGIITRLALHCQIDLEERDEDPGSMSIDWDILKKSGMITVDSRGVGYFILGPKTLFRFPDPLLTAVGGWAYQNNWKMNSDAHLAKIAGDPPHGEGFIGQTPMRVGAHQLPRPEIPTEPLQIHDEASEEENEDEDEEATTAHEVGEGSRPKRRRPVGRPSRDSRMADITSGIHQLQLGQNTQWEYMQQWREENQLWMARQESRLDACETRLDHVLTQGDARWAEAQEFYKAYYARFPPPHE